MMHQSSCFMRVTARIVMLCMLTMVVPSSAWAGMVGTEQTVNSALAEQGRAKIIAAIEREDVAAQLQARGVTVQEAKARVSSLTDEEVLQVSDKMDQLPAGGDILGLLFIVFIILLVTDILGFTKVFPFTKSVK